jgi:hypothetical protein
MQFAVYTLSHHLLLTGRNIINKVDPAHLRRARQASCGRGRSNAAAHRRQRETLLARVRGGHLLHMTRVLRQGVTGRMKAGGLMTGIDDGD